MTGLFSSGKGELFLSRIRRVLRGEGRGCNTGAGLGLATVLKTPTHSPPLVPHATEPSERERVIVFTLQLLYLDSFFFLLSLVEVK